MKFASFDKMDTAKPENSQLENQGKRIEQQSENQKLSPAETVDDNGRKYRTEDGGWLPNNEYTLDGIEYKTDDNGSVYKCDGKYYPDDWFVLNGNLFVTDADGEVIGGDIDEDELGSESSVEQKETRELTDEERQQLKEQLGWTDKQLDKCTIDDDGVIHYRTDREDMEGKTGENGVRYERKTVDIHGVKVEGVFPVFDSAFDVQLPEELEQASNAKQFRECNEQLKEAVENDPDLKVQFTDDQLEDIANGDTPEGYVWHHNEETGKMQLVKVEDHDRTQGGAAHTGGKALWGGGYSTDAGTTADANKNNTNGEV